MEIKKRDWVKRLLERAAQSGAHPRKDGDKEGEGERERKDRKGKEREGKGNAGRAFGWDAGAVPGSGPVV